MIFSTLAPEFYIWMWLAIFILCLVIEAVTTDLTSIWFALGALFALVVAFLEVHILFQIAVFLGTSLLALILTRPLVKKFFKKNVIDTNIDSIIGKVGIITKEIEPYNRGEAKLSTMYWLAKAYDNKAIPLNAEVEVLAVEGATLIVKQINKEKGNE